MSVNVADSRSVTRLILAFLTIWLAYHVDIPAAEAQTQATATSQWAAWNGTWKPGKATLAGQTLPDTQLQMMTLHLQDGKFDFQLPGFEEKGTLAIIKPRSADQPAQPGELNVTIEAGPNKGKTVPAIYRFEGKKLVICYASQGKDRPSTFGSDVENQNLLVEYVKQD